MDIEKGKVKKVSLRPQTDCKIEMVKLLGNGPTFRGIGFLPEDSFLVCMQCKIACEGNGLRTK